MAIFSGTDGNDTLTGTAESDRFLPSLGNDIIDGGDGNDILDFTGADFPFRAPITFAIGTDFVRAGPPPAPPQEVGLSEVIQRDRTITLRSVETIIAPLGESNTLSGALISNRGAGLIVDLEAKRATGFSDLFGILSFRVENFGNISGGFYDDTLVGDRNDNIIEGGSGRDILSGGDGNDRLFGGDNFSAFGGTSKNEALDGGRGNDILQGATAEGTSFPAERDVLTGGQGADTFVLGDRTTSFYKDNSGPSYENYAIISDLSRRDTIQLSAQDTYGIKLNRNGFNLSVINKGQPDAIAQVTYSGPGVRSQFTQFVNGLPKTNGISTFAIASGEELVDGILAGL
jgi:Ca2+-binding RTX toxin-like protein